MADHLSIFVKTSEEVLVKVPFDVIELFPKIENSVRCVALDVMDTLAVSMENVPPMHINAPDVDEVGLRRAIKLAQLISANNCGGAEERAVLNDLIKMKKIVVVAKRLLAGKIFTRVIQFMIDQNYPDYIIKDVRDAK